jgi:hypothetical protein
VRFEGREAAAAVTAVAGMRAFLFEKSFNFFAYKTLKSELYL